MKKAKKKEFKLEIYSDIVCPWCYVGKRYIDAALQHYRDTYPNEAMPEVVSLPFQLHAALPAQGVDRVEYMKRRYPGQANSLEMFAPATKAGRSQGVEFHFERITVQPNTMNAHRLLRFAERRDARDPLTEDLFRAYFVDGKNLSDNEVLADLAQSCGLDRAKVLTYLAGDEDREWVKEVDARAKYLGVRTVPFIILNGKKGVFANQPAHKIFDALRWARKDYSRPAWLSWLSS